MARILKEGNNHKGYAWWDTCDICGSQLKLYEDRDDPAIKYVEDRGRYKEITYECPMCGEEQKTFAAYSGRYEDIGDGLAFMRARRGHTKREYGRYSKEDLEEIRSYQKAEEEESEEPFFY